MILNEQENQYLKQYLGTVTRYRETYDELYDHVVTASAGKTPGVPLAGIVDDIIANDFGGYDNLPRLEKAAKRAAAKSCINHFLMHFAGYFKFPNLLYTAAGAVAIYFFTTYLHLASWNLWLILVLAELMQVVAAVSVSYKIFAILKLRYNQTGQLFNHTKIKPSLKESFLGMLTLTPVYLFLIAKILADAIAPDDLSTSPL